MSILGAVILGIGIALGYWQLSGAQFPPHVRARLYYPTRGQAPLGDSLALDFRKGGLRIDAVGLDTTDELRYFMTARYFREKDSSYARQVRELADRIYETRRLPGRFRARYLPNLRAEGDSGYIEIYFTKP